MKKITQEDIETVRAELLAKRAELDALGLDDLDKKLKWIGRFFNGYVPELEKRFMTEREIKNHKFLPNELRIHFYLIFPEHGLNMANYSQELFLYVQRMSEKPHFEYLWMRENLPFVNRFFFRHDD